MPPVAPARPRPSPAGVLPADWDAPPHMHGLTTLRHGIGASRPPFDSGNFGNCHVADGDDAGTVARNRVQLAAHCALPSAPHWLRQVHGTRVLRFAQAPAAAHPSEPEADAAVTATPGVVLAILTADCLPVLLAARDGGEIGAAHAGWRGLADGVLEATVAAMRAAPAELVAWLGPAAGAQAYEIGAEVFDAFVSRDARARAAFAATRPGHWRVDLYALARQRLRDAGVARVHGGGLCTLSDPQRFFSHRRDRRSGRMATLAWME